MTYRIILLLVLCALSAVRSHAAAERMFYMSEGKVLEGCVYKPKGNGPFPAIIFNQNSIKPLEDSGVLDPYPKLGRLFTSHGYVLFLPGRHKEKGEEDSGGESGKSKGDLGIAPLQSAQSYLQHITTAMLSLKAQSYVDPNRIIAMGTSAGATATLLLAEQNMDVRGYVVFSPASGIWRRSAELQSALKEAVRKADAPIFLIQPQNDFSLAPAEELGPILREKGKPNQTKIFPAVGEKKDARGLAVNSPEIWSKDVLAFMQQVLK